MISGKVALGGLTWEFGNAEKRFAELSQEVKALTKAQTQLLAVEKEIVEELARIYLPSRRSGSSSPIAPSTSC